MMSEFMGNKKLYLGLTLVFFDSLLDSYYDEFRLKCMRRTIRKMFESVIEAMPSIFLNLYSMFYRIENGDDIAFIQYFSLFLSFVTLSKTIMELRIILHHDFTYHKLLGTKHYLVG